MIRYCSERVQKEFTEAAVALRLIVDALQIEAGLPVNIMRVKDRTKFEKGVHAAGLAMDVFFDHENMGIHNLLRITNRVNNRFGKTVCTVMDAGTNRPDGSKLNQAHVHVQIVFDWLANPRAFLKAYGFLQSEICPT